MSWVGQFNTCGGCPAERVLNMQRGRRGQPFQPLRDILANAQFLCIKQDRQLYQVGLAKTAELGHETQSC